MLSRAWLLAFVASVLFIGTFWTLSGPGSFVLPAAWSGSDRSRAAHGPLTKALIVASMTGDDTTWLEQYLSDWTHHVYIMDDPSANLTVAKNKGRESTAYLTYIIDNYHGLPEIMLFLHGFRYQWHNEDPMYDGVPMIKALRLEHVRQVGYANVRCTWVLGCPAELGHLNGEPEEQGATERVYLSAFRELFPELDVPTQVGVGSGGQFALSRAKVLERPREDYIRYRQWLWDTELDEATSGRVLEYSWHIMMGKPAIHCPTASSCFCEKYGLCGLDCVDEGDCGRFVLPRFAKIPKDWPDSGEEGTNGWPSRDWYVMSNTSEI